MNPLLRRLTPVFAYAGLFSLIVNLLLLVPPLYMLQVFDRVLTSRHEETLVLLTLAAFVALSIMAILDTLRTRLLTAGAIHLDRMLSPQVIEAMISNASFARGGDSAHGLRDVASLRSVISGQAIFAVFDAPWLPLYLIVITLFHPILGAIALAGAIILAILAIANERLTRLSLQIMLAENRRASRFMEVTIRNAEVIQGMGMLGAITRIWTTLNDASLKALARSTQSGSIVTGLSRFVRQMLQIAMLGAGVWLVLTQNVTSGVTIAATIILGRALAPVEQLVGNWRGLAEGIGAYKRLSALVGKAESAQVPTPLPAPKGALSVENLSYRFPQHELPSLRQIQFSIEAGESLGLVGPSASGKTTLARLLIGIWTPLTGAVRLDGANIAQRPRSEVGPYIGYLPQDVELFSGTVADNIARLGDKDPAAVVRAAQRAHCHDLILRLPAGYDTDMGENGVSLSAGQRQRIALARAVYGNPVLVVLDEPNSNLDVEGENALAAALVTLKNDSVTVVAIAHRPSVLISMDKLLVLKNGVVEHFGPREELMNRFARNLKQAQG